MYFEEENQPRVYVLYEHSPSFFMSISPVFTPSTDLVLPLAQVVSVAQTQNSAAFVPLTWNTLAHIVPNSPDMTNTPTGFVVNTAGVYALSTTVYHTGGGARHNFALGFYQNGGALPGRSAGGYKRIASGHNESSNEHSMLVSANPGDVLSVRVARVAGSGTATIPANLSVFSIMKVA